MDQHLKRRSKNNLSNHCRFALPARSFREPCHTLSAILSRLPYWALLLLFSSCSTTRQLLDADGVRQSVYRRKTDLLLTELHYPLTNNSKLDSLLREKILKKYRVFRERLNKESIELLNRDAAFTYRATFDALRSADLRIISFVLYETWGVRGEDMTLPSADQDLQGTAGTRESQNIRIGAERPQKSPNYRDQVSTTNVEVLLYSLRSDSVVDFFDVVEEPLLVFEGLARSCLRQLNEFIGPGNYYSQGVAPDRMHLSLLSIGNSGIQVSFPPGQVMAPEQGVVNILVPWAEAIPDDPWQFGIIRSFRPLSYRSKDARAGKSAAYTQGS